MSDSPPLGEVRSEVREHTLVITVDRVAKRNAFTPKMMRELGLALTRLDEAPDLRVGVLCFAGAHTTAGLDLPLFFGSEAKLREALLATEDFREGIASFVERRPARFQGR